MLQWSINPATIIYPQECLSRPSLSPTASCKLLAANPGKKPSQVNFQQSSKAMIWTFKDLSESS